MKIELKSFKRGQTTGTPAWKYWTLRLEAEKESSFEVCALCWFSCAWRRSREAKHSTRSHWAPEPQSTTKAHPLPGRRKSAWRTFTHSASFPPRNRSHFTRKVSFSINKYLFSSIKYFLLPSSYLVLSKNSSSSPKSHFFYLKSTFLSKNYLFFDTESQHYY